MTNIQKDKRTKNDLQNTTQKTKVTWNPLKKSEVNSPIISLYFDGLFSYESVFEDVLCFDILSLK